MNGATKYGTLVAALVAIIVSWIDPSGALNSTGQAAVTAGSTLVIAVIHIVGTYEKVHSAGKSKVPTTGSNGSPSSPEK